MVIMVRWWNWRYTTGLSPVSHWGLWVRVPPGLQKKKIKNILQSVWQIKINFLYLSNKRGWENVMVDSPPHKREEVLWFKNIVVVSKGKLVKYINQLTQDGETRVWVNYWITKKCIAECGRWLSVRSHKPKSQVRVLLPQLKGWIGGRAFPERRLARPVFILF